VRGRSGNRYSRSFGRIRRLYEKAFWDLKVRCKNDFYNGSAGVKVASCMGFWNRERKVVEPAVLGLPVLFTVKYLFL
jgi:hypothetical protein